ncbi:MAG TPA: DNA primase [Vicinamibacterales bacterium]|nr:DNA primase [Vicinamibacterales bacterium]
MPLFPPHFVEDLKRQADIVVVIQDYVSLKKAGANYKGLCPFHGEKTPSFQVDRDKGFFHCFGCGVGGDVIKFLELHEKISFVDAVKQLAQRFGITLPEVEPQNEEQRVNTAERESLLKIHEVASAWFREQLLSPAGTRIRKQIADRGLTDATAAAQILGFAPPGRDGLSRALQKQGFSAALLLRAGLIVQRDDGSIVDRFRNRLMIPITRDTGSIIAFGGRAVDTDQQPKYLNSPETPIYSKSRTLYGLNLTKAAIRQSGFVILVEGYFDFGQVFQAGFPTVASCGTALTAQQAQQLRRFTSKVVLSFDPDAAGQGAAAKSSEMLVAEGFEVAVAVLPAGDDPDTFIKKHGAKGYGERLRQSRPYLEYLLDRAAAGHNLNSDEGRVKFLAEMLPVAGRIPDDAMRDRFADRLAHKARVTDEVVRAQIRKAAVQKKTVVDAAMVPRLGQVTKAEKGLIWWLVHEPAPALDALWSLDPSDFEGLAARSVLDLARKLHENKGFSPSVLLERLTLVEAQLVTGIASEPKPPALTPSSCVLEFRLDRYERERAAVQREIERLQTEGAASGAEIDALLALKGQLGRLIQSLVLSEE